MSIKNIKLLVLALSLAALMAGTVFAQVSTLDKVLTRGSVKVGVDLFVHPFGLYDQDNKPAGYDVDIAKELAKALDIKLEIVPISSSAARIPFLLTGKADVVISSFTRTLERAKSVDFTVPYAVEAAAVLTKKGSGINSLGDLKGKDVASVKGITAAIALAKLVPEAKLTLYDRHPDMVLSLLQDKVVALVDGDTAISKYMTDHPDANLVKPVSYSKEYLCFGLIKGDETWRNWLNTFIFDLWNEGTINILWKRWFPYDMPPVNVTPFF